MSTPVPDYPIQPKRYSDVTLTDAFWKPKVDLNAAVTIPFEVQKLVDGGRGFGGNVLEAAILSLQTHPNPQLQAQVEARVRALPQAPGRRQRRLRGRGDAGSRRPGAATCSTRRSRPRTALYEDFIARQSAVLRRRARRASTACSSTASTHDKKHLDLAKHYLDIRGLENSVNRSRHNQSYKPVLEQSEAVGHAVNGVTLMVSMADVGVLTGLKAVLRRRRSAMWADAVERKMYVTGGVGTTGNEGFGEPYSLPNISAYAETCAVLMFITLNHRLFLATGDSKYIDVMERGMYNNALSGVSTSGDRFFYVNRLASAGDGRDLRWERASLECCPPNLVRFLASMPGYIYAQDPNRGDLREPVRVERDDVHGRRPDDSRCRCKSEMPWGGKSTHRRSSTTAERAGAIKLRIPGWARNQAAPGGLYSLRRHARRDRRRSSVNGTRVSRAAPDRLGYCHARSRLEERRRHRASSSRSSRAGSSPTTRVKDTRGRVAIERGPIVYCAEWPDVDGGRRARSARRPDADADGRPPTDARSAASR